MTTAERVTCRKCGRNFVPSFNFDFYADGDDPTIGLCESCMMNEMFSSSPQNADPSPLPAGYETEVCKLGAGKDTCAFLAIAPGGTRCVKGSGIEATIRTRLRDGSMGAQGDNCSGPPDFTPNT